MKKILETLFAAIVLVTASSILQAQGPRVVDPWGGRPAGPPVVGGMAIDGQGNLRPAVLMPPPAGPVFPGQQDRRDDHNPLSHAHHLLHGAHGLHIPDAQAAAHGADLHPPVVIPPEVRMPASQFHYVPPSEFHVPPARFTPVASEGGTILRGVAACKGGGILAGIGGGIAAAFGSIFRRKKDS